MEFTSSETHGTPKSESAEPECPAVGSLKVCREPKYRKCVICGAMFRLLISGSQITCGNECSRERKRQVSNARVLKKKGGPTRKPCVICGEVFVVWGTQKTCSKKCAASQEKTYTKKAYKKDPEKQKAYLKTWMENPENRARVRELRQKSKIRKLAELSNDERFRMEERAKNREHDLQRRKSDAEQARLHRKLERESQTWRKKKRQEMTPEELAIKRKEDREERRRYMANPEKRARINELKREGTRRRSRDNFACTVLNAMKVLTIALNMEKSNE